MARTNVLALNLSTVSQMQAAVDLCWRPDIQFEVNWDGTIRKASPMTPTGFDWLTLCPRMDGRQIKLGINLAEMAELSYEVICYGREQ